MTLVFLDIDGTILPFGAPRSPSAPSDENPLVRGMNREHLRRLAELPAELIWATTWMHEANQALGWLTLEVLEPAEPEALDQYYKLHWKTRPIIQRAAGQNFAWLDDEHTPADQEWISEHHPGAALLIRTDPHNGLTDTHLEQLTTWLGNPF